MFSDFYYRSYTLKEKLKNKKIKNKDYENEIMEAQKFINSNEGDNHLIFFLEDLKLSNKSHSQKWSEIYDYLSIHYANYIGLTTGLAYWLEED